MQVAVVSQLVALGRWINYTSTRSIDRNRHKSLDKGHFGERNHKTNGRLDQFTETPKVCYVHWKSWKRIRCVFEKHFQSHKSRTVSTIIDRTGQYNTGQYHFLISKPSIPDIICILPFLLYYFSSFLFFTTLLLLSSPSCLIPSPPPPVPRQPLRISKKI